MILASLVQCRSMVQHLINLPILSPPAFFFVERKATATCQAKARSRLGRAKLAQMLVGDMMKAQPHFWEMGEKGSIHHVRVK